MTEIVEDIDVTTEWRSVDLLKQTEEIMVCYMSQNNMLILALLHTICCTKILLLISLSLPPTLPPYLPPSLPYSLPLSLPLSLPPSHSLSALQWVSLSLRICSSYEKL